MLKVAGREEYMTSGDHLVVTYDVVRQNLRNDADIEFVLYHQPDARKTIEESKVCQNLLMKADNVIESYLNTFVSCGWKNVCGFGKNCKMRKILHIFPIRTKSRKCSDLRICVCLETTRIVYEKF